MADYVRTQGDTAHPFPVTLTDGNGPIDLRAGDTVTFDARLVGTTVTAFSGTCIIVAPDVPVNHPQRGQVYYDPVALDVATPGIYLSKFTWVGVGSTRPQTFPEDGRMSLILLER